MQYSYKRHNPEDCHAGYAPNPSNVDMDIFIDPGWNVHMPGIG